MGSQRKAYGSILSCLLILYFISSSIFFASSSSSSSYDNGKVRVDIYYEALCPYCANFIVLELVKLFKTDLISIVNLRLIPWGNAQLSPNNTWVCQHGPDECMLNMVEACAINAWPNTEIHFELIYCIERLHLLNQHGNWQSCFNTVGLSSSPVRNCFDSHLEVRLEKQYADETARLNPPHRYVPWVVVNNRPLQDDYNNYISYVCKAYRGNKIPKACKSHSSQIKTFKIEDSITPNVCMR